MKWVETQSCWRGIIALSGAEREADAFDSVSIIMDRKTGRSCGFAFVEMADTDAAENAADGLNENEIVGRRVTVNEAPSKPKSGHRGGTGGEGRR